MEFPLAKTIVGKSLNQWRTTMSDLTVQNEKLADDLRQVITDAEQLLRMTGDEINESSAEVRGRIQTGLHLTRAKLAHLQDVAVSKSKAVASTTGEYVQENPWKSIGVAAGAGLIIGMLLRRR
jgi:ElaB/YqjD/DUF883 family membrane-anchored ribosome-binding protein